MAIRREQRAPAGPPVVPDPLTRRGQQMAIPPHSLYGSCSTVAVPLPVTPLTVAWMYVLPYPWPDTVPAPSTPAMLVLLDTQLLTAWLGKVYPYWSVERA